MLDYQSPPQSQQHPVLVIILTLLTTLIGFVLLGPFIGFLFAMPFYEGGLVELAEAIQDPTSGAALKTPLLIMQGFATLIGLIIGPSIMLLALRRSVKDLFRHRRHDLIPAIITVLMVIIFMGLNSFFIEWNSTLDLPDFLKGFEEWAREKEDYAREVTTFLTHFDSTGQFLFGFVVIAVLPAIGEELVFRGLIQNELVKASNKPHLSIWISAILFSAIHMQFFGFVPRLLLGALFGYLYYWSGNLAIAMLAHFVNNGFAVIGMYFYQQGTVDIDMESTEALAWPYLFFSALLTTVLLYYFKKYYAIRPTSIDR